MKILPSALLLSAVLNVSAREWVDTQGRKIEADYVSQTAADVKVRLKDGKEVTIAKTKLCAADQEYLKTAKPTAAPASAPAGGAGKGETFHTVKIDQKTWLRPPQPKSFDTGISFPAQIQTEHFFIAGAEKVKPAVLNAWAEGCERTYAHNMRYLPALAALFKDRRFSVWIVNDDDQGAAFANTINRAADGRCSYSYNSHLMHVELPKSISSSGGLMTAARLLQNPEKEDSSLRSGARISFVTGDLTSEWLDDADDEAGCQPYLLMFGYRYFLEFDITGNIETVVVWSNTDTKFEGFKNGRAWAAGVKAVLNNKDCIIKPGAELLLKKKPSESNPIETAIAFGFSHWCLRDEARTKQFGDYFAKIAADKKMTDEAGFAKAFGFDTVAAFDAAFTAYLKSDRFK